MGNNRERMSGEREREENGSQRRKYLRKQKVLFYVLWIRIEFEIQKIKGARDCSQQESQNKNCLLHRIASLALITENTQQSWYKGFDMRRRSASSLDPRNHGGGGGGGGGGLLFGIEIKYITRIWSTSVSTRVNSLYFFPLIIKHSILCWMMSVETFNSYFPLFMPSQGRNSNWLNGYSDADWSEWRTKWSFDLPPTSDHSLLYNNTSLQASRSNILSCYIILGWKTVVKQLWHMKP